MNKGITLFAISCAFFLVACGDTERSQPAESDPVASAPADRAPADTAPPETAPETAPDRSEIDDHPEVDDPREAADPLPTDEDTAAADPASAASATGDTDSGAAVVSDCSVTVEGNDRIRFNVDSIHVPESCSEFTITLDHVGQLPVAVMGHNVVLTTTEDYPDTAAAGLAAGADAGYLPSDDDRVIAATDMIGGGESSSVTFSTDSLEQGTEYTFFCSFPGHSALMRGTLSFGG